MSELLRISKSMNLANEFKQIIGEEGLRLISEEHEITSLASALAILPKDNLSVRSNEVDPIIAVTLTTEVCAEVCLDFVIDIQNQQKAFYLLTRGFRGGAASDQYYYYAFHPDFYVSSKYHTHCDDENKYGKYMPSNSDFTTLKIVYRQQRHFKIHHDSCAIESRIYFKDRKCTIYGINPQNAQFYAVTPDEAKYEFIPIEWLASFSEAEFSDFLHRHPHARSILTTTKEIGEDGIYVVVNEISQDKEKLGVEAYKDMILEHGEGFDFTVEKINDEITEK